jgi:hypothetical protein
MDSIKSKAGVGFCPVLISVHRAEGQKRNPKNTGKGG